MGSALPAARAMTRRLFGLLVDQSDVILTTQTNREWRAQMDKAHEQQCKTCFNIPSFFQGFLRWCVRFPREHAPSFGGRVAILTAASLRLADVEYFCTSWSSPSRDRKTSRNFDRRKFVSCGRERGSD